MAPESWGSLLQSTSGTDHAEDWVLSPPRTYPGYRISGQFQACIYASGILVRRLPWQFAKKLSKTSRKFTQARMSFLIPSRQDRTKNSLQPQETPLSLIENRLAQLEEISVELLTSIIASSLTSGSNRPESGRIRQGRDGRRRRGSFFLFHGRICRESLGQEGTHHVQRVRLRATTDGSNGKRRPSGRGEARGIHDSRLLNLTATVNYGLLPVPKD